MTDYVIAILAVIGAFTICSGVAALVLAATVKRRPSYDEWTRVQGE